MFFKSDIKLFEESDAPQYPYENFNDNSVYFGKKGDEKLLEVYGVIKNLIDLRQDGRLNTLSHFDSGNNEENQITYNVNYIARKEATQALKGYLKETIETGNVNLNRSNIATVASTTLLQQFSKAKVNSPLWIICQNESLKAEIDTAIKEFKSTNSRTIPKMSELYPVAQKMLHQYTLSGELTFENGKIFFSHDGEKYVYNIPNEWEMHAPKPKAAEVLSPSKENALRDTLWNQIITDAIDRSPGAMVAKLPEHERAEVLRTEWLVDAPLTGICTGLALEFLLDTELEGNPQSMLPSNEARYWEELLIPAMEKVMQMHYCDQPAQLSQERHYRAVYEEMIKIVGNKAHVQASINFLHIPLCQLGKKLAFTNDHTLVIIELPGTPVAGNHTIYFNTTNRTIADNGVIIQVPQDYNYGDFVDFYMEKMKYSDRSDRFSLISLTKDARFDKVHKPSMMDRLSLSAEITFNYLLRQVSVSNLSLNNHDVIALSSYSAPR